MKLSDNRRWVEVKNATLAPKSRYFEGRNKQVLSYQLKRTRESADIARKKCSG